VWAVLPTFQSCPLFSWKSTVIKQREYNGRPVETAYAAIFDIMRNFLKQSPGVGQVSIPSGDLKTEGLKKILSSSSRGFVTL
jgi:hypothetical protein